MSTNISYILLRKTLPSDPTLTTQFIWTVPSWNPTIPSGYSINTGVLPINFQQSITIPLSSDDIIIPSNGELASIIIGNNTYTELTFPSSNLRILPQPIPGTIPMILPGWSLLVVPKSYLPLNLPQNQNGQVTLTIPSNNITPYSFGWIQQASLSNTPSSTYTTVAPPSTFKPDISVLHYHIIPNTQNVSLQPLVLE